MQSLVNWVRSILASLAAGGKSKAAAEVSPEVWAPAPTLVSRRLRVGGGWTLRCDTLHVEYGPWAVPQHAGLLTSPSGKKWLVWPRLRAGDRVTFNEAN